MSKAKELSVQIVDFLDNNDLSKSNLEKWVEDRIKAYADQEVKPVQQELERWKYLYQTEFNKNKLKTDQ